METLSLNAPITLPLVFGALVSLATLLVWNAFAPVRTAGTLSRRLDDYVNREDVVLAGELDQPFVKRALIPFIHNTLRVFGRFMPSRSYKTTAQQLIYAGEPGNLSALDFMGLRFLFSLVVGGGYLYLNSIPEVSAVTIRYAFIYGLAASLLPSLWLRRRVRSRKQNILDALPDALDMLTIGVEAGLAFESALLKVGEQWDNELSQEFRRVVTEMRLGTARSEALQRMVDRTGVDELASFVAVLIQSNQMGVSISQVLHSQAEQMRIKRRQRAEEIARQASVKIVITLVFFIFPAMFIVMLGPAIPQFIEVLNQMQGK